MPPWCPGITPSSVVVAPRDEKGQPPYALVGRLGILRPVVGRQERQPRFSNRQDTL